MSVMGDESPAAMEINAERILLSSLNGLGDSITFLPVAAALRERFPDAEITFLTSRLGAGAAQLTRYFKACITPRYAPGSRKVKRRVSLLAMAPAIRKRRFDLAIMASGESSYVCAALFLSRIPARVGFNDCKLRRLLTCRVAAPARGEEHETERNLRLLAALALPVALRKPSCHVSRESMRQALDYLRQAGIVEESGRPVIILHPGSAIKNRRWPPEAFAELCERLIKLTIAQPVLLEGPYETGLAAHMSKPAGRPIPALTQLSTIELLAAAMRHAALFVGHSTGTLHLAFLAGIPTISLWGVSNLRQWGPLWDKERHLTIQSARLCHRDDDISRRDQILPCMRAIEVDQVFAAVKRKLETDS